MSRGLYPSKPVLLVDDEVSWLRSFEVKLKTNGITNVEGCADSLDVERRLTQNEYSVIALDLTMPGKSGQELLALITLDYPALPVIIITGMNQAEPAVACLKAGAFDFFVKTSDYEHLVTGVRHAIQISELQRENALLRQRVISGEVEQPDAFSDLVTQDEGMRAVFRYIEAVAVSSQPVLITGESGVGKELAARAVHRLSGRQGEFVAVNVAGLDENMFADTLFGHRRGAFTGANEARAGLVAAASGGTLFLDEIGDLDTASQVKLLRLLQEGEYFTLGSDVPQRSDIRVIVATHQDLQARQAQGQFRKDLYYRLQTHHVEIPPLRERPGDISLLFEHLLEKSAQTLGKRKPDYAREILVLLANHPFPGNVRELESLVVDVLSTHSGGTLGLEPFSARLGTGSAVMAESPDYSDDATISFPGHHLPSLKEAAEALVAEAMARAQGNQGIAARMLGISRQALNQRLKAVGNRPDGDAR